MNKHLSETNFIFFNFIKNKLLKKARLGIKRKYNYISYNLQKSFKHKTKKLTESIIYVLKNILYTSSQEEKNKLSSEAKIVSLHNIQCCDLNE